MAENVVPTNTKRHEKKLEVVQGRGSGCKCGWRGGKLAPDQDGDSWRVTRSNLISDYSKCLVRRR